MHTSVCGMSSSVPDSLMVFWGWVSTASSYATLLMTMQRHAGNFQIQASARQQQQYRGIGLDCQAQPLNAPSRHQRLPSSLLMTKMRPRTPWSAGTVMLRAWMATSSPFREAFRLPSTCTTRHYEGLSSGFAVQNTGTGMYQGSPLQAGFDLCC